MTVCIYLSRQAFLMLSVTMLNVPQYETLRSQYTLAIEIKENFATAEGVRLHTSSVFLLG